MEAFQHLRRVLERVNAVASTFLLSEIRFKDEVSVASSEPSLKATSGLPDDEDSNPLIQIWNFEPEKGNVVFCSAVDCWGFSIARFAFYWAKKLSINKNILQKHLFDDYGFNPTTKKIVKVDPYNPQIKPMFVAMILEPIWQMYEVIFTQQNPEKAAKMAKRAVRRTSPLLVPTLTIPSTAWCRDSSARYCQRKW
jgi:ribosome assembly protein 1